MVRKTSLSGGKIASPAQKSFHTRMPFSSQAAKNSSRLLDPTQLRIIVKFMSRCSATASAIRWGSTRRSSSSKPQLPPLASTRTPLTLICSGVPELLTFLRSVQVAPSSETCTVNVSAYAVSQVSTTRSNATAAPRSSWSHWLSE